MAPACGAAFGGIDNDQPEIKVRQRHRARLDPKPRYPSKDFHHKEFAKKLRDGCAMYFTLLGGSYYSYSLDPCVHAVFECVCFDFFILILFSGNRQIPGLATGAVGHSLLYFNFLIFFLFPIFYGTRTSSSILEL